MVVKQPLVSTELSEGIDVKATVSGGVASVRQEQ